MSDDLPPEKPPEQSSLEEKFKDQFMSLARALEAERYFHKQTQEELAELRERLEAERPRLVKLVNTAERVSRFSIPDRYGMLQCREASALQALRDALEDVPPSYVTKEEG
jgi:hypothetical protein